LSDSFSIQKGLKQGDALSPKEDGLEINLEETKYTLLSHHQNAGQNWDIEIGSSLFMFHSSNILERH
jgi:hypothetical protein